MKNFTRILQLSLLLILIANFSFAQSVQIDSASNKKVVMQKKSKVFIRIEPGIEYGYVQESQIGIRSLAFSQGLGLTTTIGYSFSKNIRAGVATGIFYFRDGYFPLLANVELGNHTKKVSASFNINAGYALSLNLNQLIDKPDNGVLVELLPSVSFGSFKTTSRFRISLGNQLLSTSYYNYPYLTFENQYSTNTRFSPLFPVDYYDYGKHKVVRMNMLLKFGIDF